MTAPQFTENDAGTTEWPGRDAARHSHVLLQDLHTRGGCEHCHPVRYLFELMAGHAVGVREASDG